MKKLLAALLAVLLLLGITGCHTEKTPEEPEIPDETVTEPVEEEPDTPPPQELDTPEDDQEQEDNQEETPVTDGALGAEMTVVETENSIEDRVTYLITMPSVSTGDSAVDTILNDYYSNQTGKVEDLCWGEIYEQAINDHVSFEVMTNFSVKENTPERLSIVRQTIVTNTHTQERTITQQAETFRLSDGALLLANDFFSVDEAAWTNRVVDLVRRSISENPYHSETMSAQWSDLAYSAFNKDQFYVTPDAFCVFYQDGALGQEGVMEFELPWTDLQGITVQ